MNTPSVSSASTASLALRRWLAQPHLGAAPGWTQSGPTGHSPLRAHLADIQLRRQLPASHHDIDALQRWHPWLTRPLHDIEAGLMRAAGIALQPQIRQCIHGRQRQRLIDTFGQHLYLELMQMQWHEMQLEVLDELCLPVPDWNERQQTLAYGLRLAHDVLLRSSPYLAHRLLLLFPADIVLPAVCEKGWSPAACTLASTILQQKAVHDNH